LSITKIKPTQPPHKGFIHRNKGIIHRNNGIIYRKLREGKGKIVYSQAFGGKAACCIY
jgi:hypothetical protein